MNRYKYSWFNPSYLYNAQNQERRVLELLDCHGIINLRELKILEVGCGYGYWLQQFVKWGAKPENCIGVETNPDRVGSAKYRSPPSLRIECCGAENLPFAEGSFDILLQATMFTSILRAEVKRQIASEMLRVLKESGVILWYDFRWDSPQNPLVRGIKKSELETLFPDCEVKLRRVTLAPPIGRWIAPRSRLVYQILEAIPQLCSHYLGTIKKNKSFSSAVTPNASDSITSRTSQ